MLLHGQHVFPATACPSQIVSFLGVLSWALDRRVIGYCPGSKVIKLRGEAHIVVSFSHMLRTISVLPVPNIQTPHQATTTAQ